MPTTERKKKNPRSPALSTNAGSYVTLGSTVSALNASAPPAVSTLSLHDALPIYLYRGADCSAANEVAGSPVTNTTVNGNGVYVSPTIHVTVAGTYRWIEIGRAHV